MRDELFPLVTDAQALRASVLPVRSHRYESLLRVAVESAQVFSRDAMFKSLVSAYDAWRVGVEWEEADALADDLVHVARKIAPGAEVVALIRERAKYDTYKVHLRAVNPAAGVDVASLASRLGGGGHRHEAAATLVASDDQPMSIVTVNRLVAEAYLEWNAERQVQLGLHSVETRDAELVLPPLAI
jgi:nanoRNase/pAp phosphatase (c-di-AMP/oligoRNAs hydrolase)